MNWSIWPLTIAACTLMACSAEGQGGKAGEGTATVAEADAPTKASPPAPSAAVPATPPASVTAAAPAPTGEYWGWLIEGPMADWYFRDKDGRWTIADPAAEGGPPPYEAAGIDKVIQFPGRSNDPSQGHDSNWIDANGVSYACARLTMSVDRTTKRVKQITAARGYWIGECEAKGVPLEF